MGSLALGLAGAVIGFFVGGGPTGAMIGWTLGSLAGSLLFPAKQEGPRLDDTKIQGAEYGTMRPWIFGMMRVGGIGCGQGSTDKGPNQFTEKKEKSSGKGGPEITNYTYKLSFFNEICEGTIVGVNRRWANSRLVTDVDAPSNDIWPYTLYLGDAEQMPDPTMELVYGEGEVSPMRGIAYESVEELDIADYGNARPNVEYEAFTKAGTVPTRIAEFHPWPLPGAPGGPFINYSAEYHDGVLTVASTDLSGFVYYRSQYKLDGTQIGTTTAGGGAAGSPLYSVRNLNGTYMGGHGEGPPKFSFQDSSDDTQILLGVKIVPITQPVVFIQGNDNIYQNGVIYSVGTNGSLASVGGYVAPVGIPETQLYDFGSGTIELVAFMRLLVDLDTFYSPSTVFLGTSDSGDVYAMTGGEGGGGTKLWQFDAQLNIVHFWDVAATAGTLLQANGNFHVYKNQIVFRRALPDGLNYVCVVSIDPTSAALTDTGVPLLSAGMTAVITLGGCLLIDEIGIFSMCPSPEKVILGEDIVKPILKRGSIQTPGLTDAQIDVSDLTQEVRGFLWGSQMTKHNAIMTLRQFGFFDVSEWDGAVHCIRRGHDAIANIPDGDLGAHEPGSEPPEPLETIRTPEAELPHTVWVNFYDVDHDYQHGSQYWARTCTSSQAVVTIELPMALTASEALHIAQWHMHYAWLERERFIWYTDRSWSRLCPTNVVVVRGRSIRITNKVESPSGVIKWEGVTAFAGPYTITGEIGGAPGSGQPPQVPPGARVATQLVLLDMSLASDGDLPTGFYAAMGPAAVGSWPGASLYKSTDGGVTYTAIGEKFVADVIGTVAVPLGNFTGGNVIDHSNVLRVVLSPGETLESVTELALLNGANLAAVGREWLQFMTATLVDVDTYDLTDFLRGRRGTEWAVGTHGANETFVLAPILNIATAPAELFQARMYKAVTFGTPLADAVAVTFTNTAQGARCYAPAHFMGGIGPADAVISQWIERTRTGGAWLDYADIVQADSPATFVWEVWDAAYSTCARSVPGITSPTYTYSAADQVTDFGVKQSSYYATVAQVGAFGLGIRTRAVLPGAGSVVNAPSTPVPPYNPPAVPPSGGGGSVDKVMSYPSDIYVTAGHKIGDTFVASFTTGASSPTGGYIATSEYGDPAYMRHVRLCTDAGGVSLVPGGEQWGNTCTILWASVTLAPLTTYYFVIKDEMAPGVLSGPPGAPAQMRVNLLAT